jgi:hypothetical protein
MGGFGVFVIEVVSLTVGRYKDWWENEEDARNGCDEWCVEGTLRRKVSRQH